jgi:outer membrane protein assembly factor BamB
VTERGDVVALSREGRRLWGVSLAAAPGGSESFTAPALYLAGSLLVGSRAGTLFAVDAATGLVRWRYAVGGAVFGTPVAVPSPRGGAADVLVVSQPDGAVHRVRLADGAGGAVSRGTNRCDGSAALAGGTVVYGNCDGALHLLSAQTLEPLARVALESDGEVYAGVAVAEGVAYAGDRSGRLYALEVAARKMLWVNRDARRDISATPAVRDGRVVYASDDGAVRAVDTRTGRGLWSRDTPGRPSAPLLFPDGTAAVSSGGSLLLLDARDGRLLWSREVSDEITAPAEAEGLLVVGTDDGFVVAFEKKGVVR